MTQNQRRIYSGPAEGVAPRGAEILRCFTLPREVRGRPAQNGTKGTGTFVVDLPGERSLPKTIMMIIMDGCIVSSTAQALQAAGYEVRMVRGLSDALESLWQAQPSLIIICGHPATHTYLALRNATNASILALLTPAAEADMLEALEVGADDCQPATIGNQEVLMRVHTLLRRGLARSGDRSKWISEHSP
jgi:PleD family two-component response regulator